MKNIFASKGTVSEWKTIQETIEYKTNIFQLLKRKMKMLSGGGEGTFFVLNPPDWINVLAFTEKQDLILVEQYRYGTEEITLEIPGGMVDPGETPLETAKRELLEETGFAGGNWSSLGKVSSNPAIQTNYTHIFLAENCVDTGRQHLGENEHITVHTVPLGLFLENVASGVVGHALVVAAVAKYLLKNSAGQ